MKMQKQQLVSLITHSLFLCFLFPKWSVTAQYIPPSKYDGFVFDNTQLKPDTIVIDAFFDPVCPDSRDAWPSLKQALQYYSSRVRLVLHLLPLPYHDNAFVASRALHIANILNSSSTFPLLERFFKHQEMFYNAATRNLSTASIVKEIAKFTSESVGNSYYSAIESGFNDRKTDLLTRVSFKYSASRGVAGTPVFFVNGFVLPDTDSPLDYKGWRKIIDPLIGGKGSSGKDGLHLLL